MHFSVRASLFRGRHYSPLSATEGKSHGSVQQQFATKRITAAQHTQAHTFKLTSHGYSVVCTFF